MQFQRFPKEQMVLGPTLSSSSLIPIWEDEPPTYLILKGRGAYIGENQVTVGNRDSSLKVHPQNHTQSKKHSLKSSPSQTHLLILETLLEIQKEMRNRFEDIDVGRSKFGQLFHNKDFEVGEHHTGILPLVFSGGIQIYSPARKHQS